MQYLQKIHFTLGLFFSFSCFQGSVDFLSLSLRYSCGNETDFYKKLSEFQVTLLTAFKL